MCGRKWACDQTLAFGIPKHNSTYLEVVPRLQQRHVPVRCVRARLHAVERVEGALAGRLEEGPGREEAACGGVAGWHVDSDDELVLPIQELLLSVKVRQHDPVQHLRLVVVRRVHDELRAGRSSSYCVATFPSTRRPRDPSWEKCVSLSSGAGRWKRGWVSVGRDGAGW